MKNPHAVALGKLGGKVKSAAKAAAAKANGKRPKRKQATYAVPASKYPTKGIKP